MAFSHNTVGPVDPGFTTITVTFPFLDRAHVKVAVDQIDLPGSSWVWNSDSQIELNEGLVGGETVKVYRTTPPAGVQADFQPGAFDYEQLNASLLHLLYIIQEAYDNASVAVEAGNAAFTYLLQIENLADEMEAYRNEVVGIDDNLEAAVGLATAARDLAITAKNQAQSSATTSAADRIAVAADRVVVAADKAIVAADKASVAADRAAVEGLEGSAATSAMSAASALVATQAARDQVLALYDQFDDRYLGPKAANPTVDNDGNALVGGALHFNTTANEMRLWTGSAWVAAYVSGAGFVTKVSNLSDLPDIPQARVNLGLGSVDNTSDTAKPVSIAQQAALDGKLGVGAIHAAPEKVTIADNDEFGGQDSSSGFGITRWLWSTIKGALWSSWGALTASGAQKAALVDGDQVSITDSQDGNATKRSTMGNLWTYIKGKADALYQPVKTILTTFGNLANGAGYLSNNGAGVLSWGTPAAGIPIPTSSTLAVNSIAYLQNDSGSTINDNATNAGSGLKAGRWSATGSWNVNSAQSGTWRNISGGLVGNTQIGLFVRTA